MICKKGRPYWPPKNLDLKLTILFLNFNSFTSLSILAFKSNIPVVVYLPSLLPFKANKLIIKDNGNNIYIPIKDIYDIIHLENGDIQLKNRSLLSGNREIDIYLPELGLAFEINGIYWRELNIR